MANRNEDQLETQNHYRTVVVLLLILVVFITYSSWLEPQLRLTPSVEYGDVDIATGLPAAQPTLLRIPSLGLTASFTEPLGINVDQTIEVPEGYDSVGYYTHGPTPGEVGPAVVLGHVDSYEGPAVFYSLGELVAGDTIAIDRIDGTTATFTVTRLERHEQAGFPTELVYGDIDHAGLRLVTCSGTFDREQQVYSHNLIVFAELME